jgi:7-carboxy-7-deazaguanine synthase
MSPNRFPVIEIFGPTLQGEGPDAGRPAHFVRFGGCDYRCAWCDSMHAVDPAAVRENARHLTAKEIAEEIEALDAGPRLVVLTGGNPALLDLASLTSTLRARDFDVAVETQGTRWHAWLAEVQSLIVSPKPPSSGMASTINLKTFAAFMTAAEQHQARVAVKVVIFDEADLDWACALPRGGAPLFLSVGTDQTDHPNAPQLSARYRWLWDAASRRAELADCRVLPQLHVIAWGTKVGV